MVELPTLYRKTATGAIQQWSIRVNGNTIVTEYGQLEGRMQYTNDTIREGKNLGRSNETTAAEQAEFEARSQWEKKLKRGYVETVAQAQAEEVDARFVGGGLEPMLAQSFSKHPKKVMWPCFVQPKLDGHRCIATRDAGEWSLWTRTRKQITSLPHITDALNAADHLLPDDAFLALDGELYNHDYHDGFERLTSLIRSQDPQPGYEIMQYHVYDLVDWFEGYSFRRIRLRQLFESFGDDSPLVQVSTLLAEDEDKLAEITATCLEAGYEGSMIRNLMGMYEAKRSYDLLKVKTFDDAEFLIVGVDEGRGRLAGKGIYRCVTDAGVDFGVKMKGALATLELELLEENVGSQLVVQYQGMTAYGIPRFPIGLRVRTDL